MTSRRKLVAVAAAGAAVAAIAAGTVGNAVGDDRSPKQGGVGALSNNCNGVVHQSGGGVKFFQVCVSDHGNILVFLNGTTDHVNAEGYALCDASNATNYYDAGSTESGWGAATVTQAGAKTIITRDSTDFAWRLVQEFTFVAVDREVKVLNKLVNASGVTRGAQFSRWVDFDTDASFNNDLGDKSINAVFIRDSGATGQAATLTSLTPNFARQTAIEPFATTTPQDCSAASVATPTGAGDWSGKVVHSLGNVPSGADRTVIVSYRIQ